MVKKKILNFLFGQGRNILIFLLIVFFVGIGFVVNSQNRDEIEIDVYRTGIYVVSIDKAYFDSVYSNFYYSSNLETVEEVAKKTNAKIAINTGFFDPNNKKTISYITINEHLVGDPTENENLTGNSFLKEYLPLIYNRTEFRRMFCRDFLTPNRVVYDIAQHNQPAPAGCRIIDSVQAGPELVPDFDLEKEFFILKKEDKIFRESASSLHKVARSAIGLTKNRIILVAASNQNPLTLEELSKFMKTLGVEKAMAFDGGSSTSLYVNLPDKKLVLNSTKDDAARRVKTVLMVK